ncbi:response regulator [Flavobacterium pallidum]|uniref:Response regulatory domain-containing protein n=1 Tax=Flavobacterium pallidum TaxID=2172098 RepID=A0A2S1SK69_9FLAO|nr:response regulator [Flavobacterium pallidum]AWI26785.1 hypothetical protein HYN49_13255 [Flavobacterium pallidum]
MKILMIDDHPSQIHAYKTILSCSEPKFDFMVTEAYDCQSAYEIIVQSETEDFDMIFLDRSLPPYKEKNIMSGEDLARLVRNHLPHSKLLIMTTHAEAFTLFNMIKDYHPEGLLVKSDFTVEQLIDVFSRIYEGEIFYSNTVKSAMKEMNSRNGYLDRCDQQIITMLGQGISMKSITKTLGLSRSAISRRKAQIRIYFGIDSGGDEEIVAKAREAGLI